ncbi:MAG: recombination mediator RecR [Oscillospiraceae bacterium]|nr:recombination mediator RecR [Oscillospiraceae bacterium]MDD6082373.1 recombination mediator RecR [Oscillospiraceae bacterium]
MAESSALPIILLAEQFARLPGIGMKTAQRLAYHVTSMTDNEVNDFAEALMNVKKKVRLCSVCQNMTDREVCPVCSDTRRDRKIICVVEGPKDVTAIERTGEFNGLYHVLHGLISPIDGITPDKLRIKELIARIQSDPEINEIIMATNPTVEGDATAMYISRLLKPSGIRVTRLAFGLPVGGILEYADEVTLFRALENRNEI